MIPNRFNRIKRYLAVLDKSIKISNKHDQTRLTYLKEAFEKKYVRAKAYVSFKIFLYVVLYASLLSAFFAAVPVVSQVTSSLLTVSGILGTTFCFALLAVLHFVEGTVYSDIMMLSNHMMAIYIHNDHIEHPEVKEYIQQMIEGK